MNAHVFQHAPFEGPAGIAAWLAARKASVGYTRFFEKPLLPSLKGLDLLIVMGGPMSVNDEEELPWLRDEKQLIREAIQSGLPVLGVCLGSQLIASASGARVYRGTQKEIGWFPIKAVATEANVFHFPAEFQGFHWHGETYDLPPGAVRLAQSAVTANQAFQIGRRTLALQFHLEVTPEAVRAFVENCGDELHPAPYVQDAAKLTAAPDAAYAEINALMDRVLNYLTAPEI